MFLLIYFQYWEMCRPRSSNILFYLHAARDRVGKTRVFLKPAQWVFWVFWFFWFFEFFYICAQKKEFLGFFSFKILLGASRL